MAQVIEDDTLPNITARSMVGAFVAAGPGTSCCSRSAPSTSARSPGVWQRRSSEVAQTVVIGLYPSWDISQAGLDAADGFLADPDVPPALRRLVLEGRAGVERALRARAFDIVTPRHLTASVRVCADTPSCGICARSRTCFEVAVSRSRRAGRPGSASAAWTRSSTTSPTSNGPHSRGLERLRLLRRDRRPVAARLRHGDLARRPLHRRQRGARLRVLQYQQVQ